ncbi:MAG: hypothetical protein K2H35_00345 [Muribaculaceae bacterium]|nr:hypothetical protein [Muribaculaceae bacterium]
MGEKILKYILAMVMLCPVGCDIARASSLAEVIQNSPETAAPAAGEPTWQGVEESVPADNAPGMSEEYLDAKVLLEMPHRDSEATDSIAPADDEPLTVVEDPDSPYNLEGKRIFNPDPARAVWLSALFPGLGQIYNRRYWKLPIIVAGYMGLGYGTSWNARMFQDYQRAYADIMDDDPDTKSYLDFFPPTVDESSLDKTWLTQVLKSRKDYYRRNRDLCIICCVGLYLLAMLDAYVDASLTHFDVSDDLSLDVAPSILITPGSTRPAPALHWAFTF